MGNMYPSAKTWSPFKGCLFDCTYCRPTFQAQAKRQKHNCTPCYDYAPHIHLERFHKFPSGADIIFACGNGDIHFCPGDDLQEILGAMRQRAAKRPETLFYLQSKAPAVFDDCIGSIPENTILVTTLETNRDAGYSEVSKAPPPTERAETFLEVNWPRKVVTVEPLMDFDLVPFADMIADIEPEYVWIGFNSRPKQVQLPEPSLDKARRLIDEIRGAGIEVKGKTLRGIVI